MTIPSGEDLAAHVEAARGPLHLAKGSYTWDGRHAGWAVEIRGAGVVATPIFNRSEDDWLTVPLGARWHLSDLSLRRRGPASHSADLIVVRGRLILERCRLEGATGDGHRGGVGIRVVGGGEAELTETVITRCSHAAVAAFGRARITALGGAWLGGRVGAWVADEAMVAARRTEIGGEERDAEVAPTATFDDGGRT